MPDSHPIHAAEAAYVQRQAAWLDLLQGTSPHLELIHAEDRTMLATLPFGIFLDEVNDDALAWALRNLPILRSIAQFDPTDADFLLLGVSELSTHPNWDWISAALLSTDPEIENLSGFLEVCSELLRLRPQRAYEITRLAFAGEFRDMTVDLGDGWNPAFPNAQTAVQELDRILDSALAVEMLGYGVPVPVVMRFVVDEATERAWEAEWHLLADQNALAAAEAFTFLSDPAIPGSDGLARCVFWLIDEKVCEPRRLAEDPFIELLTNLQVLGAGHDVRALQADAGEDRDLQVRAVAVVEVMSEQLGTSTFEALRRLMTTNASQYPEVSAAILANKLTDTTVTVEHAAERLSIGVATGGFGDVTESWRPIADSRDEVPMSHGIEPPARDFGRFGPF